MDLRNTPANGNIGSPVQRLMGRRTNTLIPTANTLLQPKIIDPQSVYNQIRKTKRKQKEYYDQHTKDLPTLKLGERIRIKDKSAWKPAIITQIHANPRSYIVRTTEGNLYRRNRRHIIRNHDDREDDTENTPLPRENDRHIETPPNEQQMETETTNTQRNDQASIVPRRSTRITAMPARYSDIWAN